MTAKEYLKQIKMMRLRIDEKREQAQSIRETIRAVKAVSYAGTKTKTQPGDHIGDSVSKLEEAERELMVSAVELEEKRTETVERVHRVNQPEYAELLYLRYVKMMSWEATAEKMSYSIQHLFKLHRKALSAFAKANKDLFFRENEKNSY